MLKAIFTRGLKTIKCPDGTTRTVYTRLEEALHSIFRDSESKFSAKIKTSAIDAEIASEQKAAINTAATYIDQNSQSIQMSYKLLYMTYAADPCNQHVQLSSHTIRLLEEHRLMARVALQIDTLLAAHSNKAITKAHFAEQLACCMQDLRLPPPVGLNAHKMNEAVDLAKKLSAPK